MLAADYGSDLPSVKEELDRQQHEQKIIDQFHSKILNDERQQTKFTGDELNLYQQRLNQLQKVYAELLSTSTKRLSDLDSLQHFLKHASDELQWLSEKEQVEITRDWADKQLDLPSVHRYYEVSFGIKGKLMSCRGVEVVGREKKEVIGIIGIDKTVQFFISVTLLQVLKPIKSFPYLYHVYIILYKRAFGNGDEVRELGFLQNLKKILLFYKLKGNQPSALAKPLTK